MNGKFIVSHTSFLFFLTDLLSPAASFPFGSASRRYVYPCYFALHSTPARLGTLSAAVCQGSHALPSTFAGKHPRWLCVDFDALLR